MDEKSSQEFGRLIGRVEALEVAMVDLRKDVKQLLALVNQSRGGLWMGMVLAGFIGSLITWAVALFPKR